MVEERAEAVVHEEVGELPDGRTIRFFSWEEPDDPAEPDPAEPA
ncbi:MAG TPA: hypothetical protein VNP37_18595 [Actinomycetospora sp.]|nr:hypothetical protein [Actinomycetospora sp.]